MKKKLTAALLAALLICGLAGVALAEEAPDAPDITLETEVSIGFEGAVYFVEMETGGMDIDFGSHVIPPRGILAVIPASDRSHTLRVCDRRATPGKWRVNAITSIMSSETGAFSYYINLYNPTVTTGITPNVYGTAPTQFMQIVPSNTAKIMEATLDITPGEYDLTTTAENTRLHINVGEIPKVKPLEYSATITWTLVLEP